MQCSNSQRVETTLTLSDSPRAVVSAGRVCYSEEVVNPQRQRTFVVTGAVARAVGSAGAVLQTMAQHEAQLRLARSVNAPIASVQMRYMSTTTGSERAA